MLNFFSLSAMFETHILVLYDLITLFHGRVGCVQVFADSRFLIINNWPILKLYKHN